MHSNKIWLIFLTAITFAVGWFFWGAADQLIKYYSLQEKRAPLNIEWKLLKIHEENYLIQADYAFIENNKRYEALQLFEKPVFSNLFAAEHQLNRMKAKKWAVWFSPRNPHISSLEKKFPLKQLLSTITLLGLWLYFVWLGIYVTQFQR